MGGLKTQMENNNSKIFTFGKLYSAYLDCRKNKRNSPSAAEFEVDFEKSLFELEKKLKNKTYKPGKSICFAITNPSREVFAANFKDRVIHHLLIRELEEWGEKRFIYDSFSCRKNKGTHLAVERVKKFIRKITDNYKKNAYYCQLDISGFFMNIDHKILLSLVEDLILKADKSHDWKKETLWLSRVLITHKPTQNFVRKGDKEKFTKIPPRKSLFHAGKGKGLPIGNYCSQFFANLYLNESDQFIKRELKRNYYARYADDFLFLSRSKSELKEMVNPISEFLKEKLKLELNPTKTKIKSVREGIDFLGYITNPDYVLIRNRVVNALKDKLYKFEKSNEKPKEIISVINSYFGYFNHGDGYNLRKSLFKNHISDFEGIIPKGNLHSFFEG